MPPLKIGIQLASLRLPLKRAMTVAAELGARAVEIDARGELRPRDISGTAARQIRKLLDDLNLRVCAIGFRTRRGYGSTEDLERRIEATKDAMRMAYALRAPVVVNHVGRVPPEDSSEWQTMQEALSELGRFGHTAGALLAAETGSESGEEMARLIDALPAGSLGVNLDPGNLIVSGFSPLEAIAALGSHIVHVHAKDGVRDLAQGRGVEVPLGQGSCDFPALLAALEECGYRGYFTIERENARDPLGEIAAAVEYLKSY